MLFLFKKKRMRKKYILSIQKQCLKSLKTFSYKGCQINRFFFCGVKYCERRLRYMHCVQLINQLNPQDGNRVRPQHHEDFGYFNDMTFISKCPKTQFPEFKKRGPEIRVKPVESDRRRHTETPNVLIPISILIQ